jgi:hypothetical protein
MQKKSMHSKNQMPISEVGNAIVGKHEEDSDVFLVECGNYYGLSVSTLSMK